MDSVNFFSVASQHNRWLSVRQSVTAQNIANANTPGYKAVDIQPFEAVLNATGIEMTATKATHMKPQTGAGSDADPSEQRPTWDVVHSGNSVTLEEQLMRSSEITGAYNRNTSIMKTLHRMYLASTRG
jgi:flagellar basal-body rod protein FlgB